MISLQSLFPRPTRSLRAAIRFLTSTILTIILSEALYNTLYYPPSYRVTPPSIHDPPLEIVGKRPKIFIASIHRNNAAILSSHWTNAVLNLIDYLGAENVYFSTYESGSIDNTKEQLTYLDSQLEARNVARTVILDPIDQLQEVAREVTSHEPGWIQTGRGKTGWEIRRIPYLANLRNKVLEPFYASETGKWDTILWLNDVVFTTSDILTLFDTRDGNWDAVCALDFADKQGRKYYDTFALRDASGEEAMKTWPFFIDDTSRAALKVNKPVPVRSCWNGIAAFKTEPFYDAGKRRLAYRGADDGLASKHVEGSECCFVHADLESYLAGEGRKREGVWVNPNVRVGFNAEAYNSANPVTGGWPDATDRVTGTWKNRLVRWFGHSKRKVATEKVLARVWEWMAEGKQEGEERREVGDYCLVDEMQVLFEAGWMHV